MRGRAASGGGLLHPLPLLAVAVLLLNDHWLKAAYGGWWTGKLSDVAGLAFFPLLLQAAWEVARFRPAIAPFAPSRRVLLAAAAATACTFSAIQTWALATDAYRHGLGLLQWPFRVLVAIASGLGTPGPLPVAVTADVTDLLALPALGLAVWAGWRR